MAEMSAKDRFDAAVKVIQSLPKNGKVFFLYNCTLAEPFFDYVNVTAVVVISRLKSLAC